MEIHTRTMVVRSIEEIDAENVRVHCREAASDGASIARGGPAMPGGSGFSFPIALESAPNVMDEVTVAVSTG